MDFITQPDPDFDRLHSNPTEFETNYEYNINCLGRRTVFSHAIKSLKEVRNKID